MLLRNISAEGIRRIEILNVPEVRALRNIPHGTPQSTIDSMIDSAYAAMYAAAKTLPLPYGNCNEEIQPPKIKPYMRRILK
jgi:hypothetical protein